MSFLLGYQRGHSENSANDASKVISRDDVLHLPYPPCSVIPQECVHDARLGELPVG